MKNEQVIDWVTYLVTYVKKEDNQKKQSKRGKSWWWLNWSNIEEYTWYLEESEKPFCYPTEADCIKARDKILALYRIKEYCNEQRGEFVPDWSNDMQEKYFIYYCAYNKRYEKDYEYHRFETNKMYVEKEEHCKEIIEKFKDDLDILFDRTWK